MMNVDIGVSQQMTDYINVDYIHYFFGARWSNSEGVVLCSQSYGDEMPARHMCCFLENDNLSALDSVSSAK